MMLPPWSFGFWSLCYSGRGVRWRSMAGHYQEALSSHAASGAEAARRHSGRRRAVRDAAAVRRRQPLPPGQREGTPMQLPWALTLFRGFTSTAGCRLGRAAGSIAGGRLADRRLNIVSVVGSRKHQRTSSDAGAAWRGSRAGSVTGRQVASFSQR